MEHPVKKLQKTFQSANLDGVLVSSISNVTFLTSFSGFESGNDRNVFLLITKSHQYIFTHGIYTETAQTHAKDFTLVSITRENPLTKSLGILLNKHRVKKLGIETIDLSVREYFALTKQIDKKLLVPADNIFEKIRVTKNSSEIQAIEKACNLGDKAFSYLITQVKMGISEKKLAFLFDMFVRKNGAEISFPTIIAFGSNTSLPHHVPTHKKLQKNEFILMDFGTKVNNYCSDMTRTVVFGKANEKQKKMYQTVLTAQLQVIQQLHDNATKKTSEPILASSIDKVARDYIISQGFPNIPHSLGHGIGLEVHEAPRLSPTVLDVLGEGMVFSLEPGIYLPGIGGVRIEDLVVIEQSGIRELTHAPKQLIEI